MSKMQFFRADHIGSLLRPKELIEARHQFREKKISEAELKEIEDRSIQQVVKLQEDIGLEVVTDGEFRRGAFFSRYSLRAIHKGPLEACKRHHYRRI